MFLLSIITVVYNGEAEIERTIKSVLQQNYKNFEFIIIDGSSTDSTLQIIEKFKEDIDIIVSEPDKGIYDAMNKAIDLANGEWLYFLNCGDAYINNSVLLEVSYDLQMASNNVYVYQVNVVDKNQKIIDRVPRSVNFSSYRDLFYTRFCHQSIIARREGYLTAGKFDLNFKVYSDFYTIAKILKTGAKLVFRTNIIADYNNNGVSNDWKKVIYLSKEREIILSLLDGNFSGLRFIVAIFKSYLYYLRKFLQSNG